MENKVKDIVKFIRDKSQILGTEGAVIGLSGGVDSTLCVSLLVKALGKENVFGVMMPEKFSNTNDLEDAKTVANWLDISYGIHDISKLLELYHVYDYVEDWDWDEIKEMYRNSDSPPPSKIEYHFQMRLRGRMYTLTHYARSMNYFMCQTINKTEWLLGMLDPHGDGAGEIAPIFNLYKTEVFDMARFLELPRVVLDRKPEHGLTPISITEEFELGMDYVDTDKVLKYVVDSAPLPDSIPEKKISLVRDLVNNSQWKRDIPYTYTGGSQGV